MSEANGEAPEAAAGEAKTQEEQRAALFGPHGRGEYHEGVTVRFWDAVSRQERIGKIDYIRGPAPAYKGGPPMPTTYFIDAGDGSPHVAYQSDILEVISG